VPRSQEPGAGSQEPVNIKIDPLKQMNRYDEESSPYGFEDLEVYQVGCLFRRRIYKLAKMLPPEEKFDLARQMRRAAVSLTNNIAEGYGRHHWQENSQFCRQSRGSLLELVDDINICVDEKYADTKLLEELKKDAKDVLRLLNGYIAYLQRKKASQA
jgi:four helix bundle protein